MITVQFFTILTYVPVKAGMDSTHKFTRVGNLASRANIGGVAFVE